MSFWDSVTKTLDSFGDAKDAVLSAPGVLWDLGTMVFDGEDQSFGDYVDVASGRTKDLFDPIMNDETLTGLGFQSLMDGLEYVYREEISEPTAAAFTQLGSVFHTGDVSALGGEGWGRAYATAQDRSMGQAAMLASANWSYVGQDKPSYLVDPMDERAWEQLSKENETAASLTSGALDFTARWFADPGVLIGKGAAGVRSLTKGGKITPAERAAGLRRILDGEVQAQHGFTPMRLDDALKARAGNDLKSRYEKVFDFMETGANGAPLNETQIFLGVNEIRGTVGGRRIAGLLAEAGKIKDPAARRDAWRSIFSIANGDTDELFRVRDELDQTRHLVDELKNIGKGNVVDLKASALGDEIMANPTLHAHLQGQLDRAPKVREALDNHVNRLEMLVGNVGRTADEVVESADTGVFGVMKNAAGVSGRSKRALARDQGKGLLRDGTMVSGPDALKSGVNKALDKTMAVDDYLTEAAARFAQHPTMQTVFQSSMFAVPARVVTPVAGFGVRAGVGATKFWATAPQKFADKLREIHPSGTVNLHDWDNAQGQLDAMLKGTKVADGTRWSVMGKAALARTEQEKQRIIEEAESASIMSLAERYGVIPKARQVADEAGEKFTSQHVRDYMAEVVGKGNKRRQVWMTPRRGRVYAAAFQDPLKARNADEAIARGEAIGRAENTVNRVKSKMRVDQRITDIDENGIPNILADPVLETQLANKVPLLDTARIEQVLKRDAGRMSQHAKAWANLRYEADRLTEIKRAGGHVSQKTLDGLYAGMDTLSDVGMMALRTWKYSVLFRLGYPIRIVLDDHARILAQMGAAAFLLPNLDEAVKNVRYNKFGRSAQVRQQKAILAAERDQLDTMVTDDMVAVWTARDEQIRALNKRIDKLTAAAKESTKRTKNPKVAERRTAVRNKAKALREERDTLQAMQSDDPNVYRRRLKEINEVLNTPTRKLKKGVAKRHVGDADTVLEDGTRAQGAFGGDLGDAWRTQSSSNHMFREGLLDHEGKVHASVANEGGWDVIIPTEVNEIQHLTAWADVANNQFRQSKVAMHFIDGGDVQTFTTWLKEPAQKELRKRMAHYANDPEDWGNRVSQLVDQYLPTQQLRDAVRSGRVTPDDLKRMWGDKATRPAVHGATVAHNLGNSRYAAAMGGFFNKMFSYLSDVPTDRLSRHPYFAAVYKSELNELHLAGKAAAERAGRAYTDGDLRYLENVARKRALGSLKQTLFDIESHSSAAHMMRFVSPFFAAHQEAMTRWWRIVSDDPSVLRRIQQTFDMPRKVGMVVDQDGDPVEPGDTIGANHRVLLQLPGQLGGNTGWGKWINEKWAGWEFSENSMNLILQGGSPFNPGFGPAVTVPAESLLHQLPDEKQYEDLVRLLNPYPSDASVEQLLPATVKRLITLSRGEKSAEYLDMWHTNFNDRLATFLEQSGGKYPTKAEQERLWDDAKSETNFETVARFFQNFVSPFPARPKSKFSVVQGGYQKLREQADAEGRSFDWVMEKFKEQYGDAYRPLIQSQSVNISNMPITNRAVESVKAHKGLLRQIDPRLHGAVVGPEGAYSEEAGWSSAAARYFKTTPMETGSSATYLTSDDPAAAFVKAAEMQGWSDYSDMMDAITALAVDAGLSSWRDSDKLVEIRNAAVDELKARNDVWAEDYDTGLTNPKAFDYVLDDLRKIATNRSLTSDPARTDVSTLQQYLEVRDFFTEVLRLRAEAGGASTMQAQANADLQRLYVAAIGELEESNMDFQRYYVNGTIDRDPFLRTDDIGLQAAVNELGE